MFAPGNTLDARRAVLVAFPSRRMAHLSQATGCPVADQPAHAPGGTVLAFRPRAATGPRPSSAPATGPSAVATPSQAPAPLPAQVACTTDAPADPAGIVEAHTLTVADRIALLSWFNGGGAGYARFVLETGLVGGAPDCSGYALLYRHDDPWAVLGVTRVASGILIWHCGSGTTHGIYPAMAAALHALPPACP